MHCSPLEYSFQTFGHRETETLCDLGRIDKLSLITPKCHSPSPRIRGCTSTNANKGARQRRGHPLTQPCLSHRFGSVRWIKKFGSVTLVRFGYR